MKRGIKIGVLVTASLMLSIFFGCSIEHESTIGQFTTVANFPMYYLVGGDDPKSGALYKVSEVSEGQTVESELVASGFTSTGSPAQDTAGNIYIPEVLPEPDGRILKLAQKTTEAKEFIVDLDYPTGVALDTFNQLYVIENGKHRVMKNDASGMITAFKDTEIHSPEMGIIDDEDNLYLVETGASVVSKTNASGVRKVVTPTIDGIISVAIDAAGVINILTVDANEGTGKILRVIDENTTNEVVTGLINPLSFAFDSANAMYIAEGAPANRISRYASGESSRRVIVNTVDEPRALIFTPF
jgi:sugar lactone lactonase YvrE